MKVTKEKIEKLIPKLKFKFPYSAKEYAENLYLENYHSHTDFSNTSVPDCAESIGNYAERIKELGTKCIFSGEHGNQGNAFEVYSVSEKYNLSYRHSAEAYWVKDRLKEYPNIDKNTGEYKKDKNGDISMSKDRANCHIILVAKNDEGRKDLNFALSRANEDGYYYQPRLDMELLLDIPKDNMIITTACLAGWKYDDAEEYWLKLAEHFGDNFFVELQYHNTPLQKEINKRALSFAKKHNLQIICGLDSHYVKAENSIKRDQIQKYKKVHYDDEDGWYMDYPDTEEVIRRFEEQGVLTEEEILTAIMNTNVFVNECEEIKFDRHFKIPSIYKDKIYKEKVKIYKHELNQAYKKEKLKSKDKADGIRWEAKQIIDSHTVDYFLTSKAIIDRAVHKYGGILTTTSRGCFEGQALVHTKESFKRLDSVVKGDLVLGDDGIWHKVINTFIYNIKEDMIEFEYLKQGSLNKKYNNVCTTDHKILIKRNEVIDYIPAQDIKEGDLLCSPIIKDIRNEIISYDLNNYNVFGYEYDEKYIYEKKNINVSYKFSPKEIERMNVGVSSSFCERIIGGYRPTRKDGLDKLQTLLKVTPFKSADQYAEYCKKRTSNLIKIPRYITLNGMLNIFIGMMYGDGWNITNRRLIGLAINRTSKNTLNKYVFYKIADMFNCDVYVNESKTKNLIQLTISSHILSCWFEKEFFSSKKHKMKTFNKRLLNQSIKNLEWLYRGLARTDGSIDSSKNKLSFDNTSLSIISAYSILDNIVNSDSCPLSLDIRLAHDDNRGFHSKESYKLRRNIKQIREKWKVEKDGNYWFLPIKKIIRHKQKTTTVYDIEVEGCHSYTINNVVVHNSAASFVTNKLLGLTTVDRFNAEIPIYPERFLTKERVLAGQMPDIDLNIAEQEPFIKASRDLLGEHGCYPLMALRVLKEKAAWQLYAGASDVSPEDANRISKYLDEYNKKLKHTDEEDKWMVKVEDFIPNEYLDLYNQSLEYQGITINLIAHPCGHLIFDGDIRREIGLITAVSESTGERTLCAAVEGKYLDSFGYVKEDFLIVDSVHLTYKLFKGIGQPVPSFEELKEMIKDDDKTWEIYEKGITCCVNQCEKESTTNKVKKYKNHNIAETSAFIAGIRPGFASLINIFLNREEYSTGEKKIDDLLEDSAHYMIYQESIMKVLSFLGLPMSETYGVIKSISKKKLKGEKKEHLLQELKESWLKIFGNLDNFNNVWKVIEDSAAYAFNAPHAYSMAGDSLYQAWFKAHHTAKFYEVAITHYQEKNKKDKIDALVKEALKFYGFKLGDYEFGTDNRKVNIDEETKTIYPNLSSVKGFGEAVVNTLYELGKNNYDNFIDVLIALESNGVNKTIIEQLIKINYFKKFGDVNTLLKTKEYYHLIYGSKQMSKEKIIKNGLDVEFVKKYGNETAKQINKLDSLSLLKDLVKNIPYKEWTTIDTLKSQLDVLGIVTHINPSENKRHYFVSYLDIKKSIVNIQLYEIYSGITRELKMWRTSYDRYPFEKGDLLYIYKIQKKNKRERTGEINPKTGKAIYAPVEGVFEFWLDTYRIEGGEECYD